MERLFRAVLLRSLSRVIRRILSPFSIMPNAPLPGARREGEKGVLGDPLERPIALTKKCQTFCVSALSFFLPYDLRVLATSDFSVLFPQC